jgi:hypothetical protein
MLSFNRISTWEPGFVAAIRRHYTGSRGAPVGKKMAWEIHEDGMLRGWIGLGEPSFKLAPRRLLGLEDARPAPRTVGNFIFRLELPGTTKASGILRKWHLVAERDWADEYGWTIQHWETLIDPSKTASVVCGACYRRAGYRHIGSTTGRSCSRPVGHSHGPRVWRDGTVKEMFYRGPLVRISPDNSAFATPRVAVATNGVAHEQKQEVAP